MKRDVFHYYEADIKAVCNAYVDAVKEKFGKDCCFEPYHTITFGLPFSLKYNINGGACHIHFIPYKSGTAVGIRYTIVQLFGARYKAHDADMTEFVNNVLGTSAKEINIGMDVFMNDANRIFDEGLKRGSAETITAEKTSFAEELQELKKLLDAGILTQEEFDAKKKQLLGL